MSELKYNSKNPDTKSDVYACGKIIGKFIEIYKMYLVMIVVYMKIVEIFLH